VGQGDVGKKKTVEFQCDNRLLSPSSSRMLVKESNKACTLCCLSLGEAKCSFTLKAMGTVDRK